MSKITAPEQRTIDVDVGALDTRGRTVVGYAATYGTLSEDLGGYREQISPGAFAGVLDADVRALLNHDPNEVLGRTKSGTLRLFDEPRGLRFELDLPDSPLGENMRTAIGRGDLDGASFRFEVGDEAWDGDLRTIKTVKALHDVTLATYPAYPAASVELRTKPTKEEPMDEQTTSDGGVESAIDDSTEKAEQRSVPAGTFRVTERNEQGPEGRTLWGQFQQAGFTPGVGRAEISWPAYMGAAENRAITMGTTTLDQVSGRFFSAPPLQYDSRWAWPALQSVPVDAATTSVNILAETSRTLIAGGTAVRAINATSSKPEVALTVLNTPTELKQIAGVVAGVPNIVWRRPGSSRRSRTTFGCPTATASTSTSARASTRAARRRSRRTRC